MYYLVYVMKDDNGDENEFMVIDVNSETSLIEHCHDSIYRYSKMFYTLDEIREFVNDPNLNFNEWIDMDHECGYAIHYKVDRIKILRGEVHELGIIEGWIDALL